MTETDLVKLLSERFHENFADETARAVLGADGVELLYDLVAFRHGELPKPRAGRRFTDSSDGFLKKLMLCLKDDLQSRLTV